MISFSARFRRRRGGAARGGGCWVACGGRRTGFVFLRFDLTLLWTRRTSGVGDCWAAAAVVCGGPAAAAVVVACGDPAAVAAVACCRCLKFAISHLPDDGV